MSDVELLVIRSVVMQLLLLAAGTSGCSWSSWSPCSVTCGKGTKNRVATADDCTVPLTAECNAASCTATHLARLGVTAIQWPGNLTSARKAEKLIDGTPVSVQGQVLDHNSACAATSIGTKPWARLDLQIPYLVSVVRPIMFWKSGPNVEVRVGNSLTNDGNDNHLCGRPAYDGAEAQTRAIWKNVSCTPPVWGRYINFQRTDQDSSVLFAMCEVSFKYDDKVDVRIDHDGTNVDGHNISVYEEGQGLAEPINCAFYPSVADFSESLTWKHNNIDVQTLSSGQQADIYQVEENDIQRLYIKRTTDSTDGVYSCQHAVGNASVLSKSFTLVFKNVDCVWSSWSTCVGGCGAGTQSRHHDPPKQHDGVDCTGPSQQSCDTGKPPCMLTGSTSSISVDEGMPSELSCEASQFDSLSSPITFGWFREHQGLDVDVTVDKQRVANSTAVSSEGTTKYNGKLSFLQTLQTDTGSYKCKAFNLHGTSILSAARSIDVQYGPELVNIHPANPLVVKGGSITLSCSADGNPTPTDGSYKWQHAGSADQTVQNLMLSDVQFEDSGMYTCVVKNTIQAGDKTASATVELRVEGPPQKCLPPSASGYEGSNILFTVNCPKDGNSVITKYEIQYQTKGTGWVSVTFNASVSQPFIVQFHTPFTPYDVRVRAANKHGSEKKDKSFSDIATVMTAEAEPESPSPVDVTILGSRSAVVSWSQPSKPNGLIRYYFLYIHFLGLRQRRDDSSQMSLNVTETTTTVTKLRPFSNYDIQVAAVTVRQHDGKVLVGQRSSRTHFRTKEDVALSGSTYSTGYLNGWDGAVAWHVPSGYAIVGVYSYHDNHKEDRRWSFLYQNINFRSGFGYSYGLGITGWDSAFSKECISGYILTYISSWHSNHYEDRRWTLRCSSVSRSKSTNCFWTRYLNWFDGVIDYRTPPDQRYVITGVASYHNNHYEDRRFKFKACQLVLY